MSYFRSAFFCLLVMINLQAEAGSISACDNVIRSGNESWAYTNCLSAAENGTPKAQVIVGMALMTGVGVIKNPELAVSWFKRAAEQNYPTGLYQLGLAEIAGIGVEQNDQAGMVLIQKAAKAGDPDAKSFLAELGVPAEPEKPKTKKIKNDCTGVGCGRPLDGFMK